MKRSFLFFTIATLISLSGASGITTPVSATAEEDAYHWTLGDLVGAMDGTNTEIWSRPYCQDQDMGGDPMMGMLQNPCIQALQQFALHGFIVSAVNPSKSTIKVLFRDNSYFGEAATRADLYLFWHESPFAASDIFDFNNTPEGIRDFLHISSSDLSTGILQPNKEIELTITENQDLLNDPSHQILYILREDDYAVNTAGFAQYQTCFQEGSGYQDGMECQIRFDDYMNVIYVPVATEEITPGSEQPSGEGATTEDGAENTMVATDVTAENASGEGYGGAGIISASNTVKSPETGANTKTQDGNTATEFPWWLGLIFGLGALTLTWLFWPKKTKKN